MKPTLQGRLHILDEALGVAYTRCRQAAGAAEPVDAELCEQLLAMSGGLADMLLAMEDVLSTLEPETNVTTAASNHFGSPNDYPQGPPVAP